MDPTLAIVLLWLAFGGSHVVLSSLRLRPKLVAKLGDQGFMGVYSLISLGCFVPLVMIYFRNKHSGPLLWAIAPSLLTTWIVYIGMGVAFVLLVAGLVSPAPSVMSPGGKSNPQGRVEPRGIHFITRHAVFMAMAIFGVVHLIPNGFATDVAFFAGFPLFVLIGAMHQDRRKLATEAERYGPFHAATPLIPFTGSQTVRGLKELSKVALVVGIGVTVLLRYLHPSLFG